MQEQRMKVAAELRFDDTVEMEQAEAGIQVFMTAVAGLMNRHRVVFIRAWDAEAESADAPEKGDAPEDN